MGKRGDIVDGRYVLGEQLGRGGMGEVFRATDTDADRAVALKVLTSTEPGGARRFRSEADLLARLDHPGVVRLHGSGIHDGVPYLVLDLADGPSLSRELADGPLELDRVRRAGAEVADGLAHAHEHGIVHRDVKPSNVLFGADGRARLSDFGIARLTDGPGVTRPGQLVGTAPYLAPEQVAGDEVGPAADVYALGLVVAECLTGRPCFPGNHIEAALSRLHRPPPLPRDVPAWLHQVLAAMTAREPSARPPARDVASALRQADVGPVLVGTEVHERPPVVEPAPTRLEATAVLPAEAAPVSLSRRRPRAIRALAVVGIVAASLVGLVLSTGAGSEQPPAPAVDAVTSGSTPATTSTPSTAPTGAPAAGDPQPEAGGQGNGDSNGNGNGNGKGNGNGRGRR